MYSYLLVIFLLFLVLFLFAFNKKFISASFIASLVWLFCSIVFLFMSKNYEIQSISSTTLLVILAGLFSLFFGENIAGSFLVARNSKNKKKKWAPSFTNFKISSRGAIDNNLKEDINGTRVYPDRISINATCLMIVCLFEFVVLCLIIYSDYALIVQYNGSFPSSLSKAYGILRLAKNSGLTWPWIVTRLYECSYILSAFCSFPAIFNLFHRTSQKTDFLLIVPFILFGLSSMLSSGRTDLEKSFIYLIMFSAVSIWSVPKLSLIQKWKKLLVVGLACFSLFGLLFVILGVFRNGTKLSDGLTSLSFYVSSSIGALDHYVNFPFGNETGLFGFHTFSGCYSLFSKLIPTNYSVYMPLETVSLGTFSTNIYTPFRRYIQDFGTLGLFLFPFLTGAFYGSLEYLSEKKDSSLFWKIALCLLFYPIFEYSIEERFFNQYFSFSFAFKCLVFAVCFYFLVSRHFLYNYTQQIVPYFDQGSRSRENKSVLPKKTIQVLSAKSVCACFTTFNPDIFVLKKTLSSIAPQVNEVFIFDDGSILPWWESFSFVGLENVHVVLAQKNEGIAKRLNDALKRAECRSYAWMLLLDQDSFCSNDFVSQMALWINANDTERIGIVCPNINYRNMGHYHCEVTGNAFSIPGCITSGSLINVSICEKLNGFDESLIIDFVDFDYCEKLKTSGYDIICLDYLILNHELGDSRCLFLPISQRNLIISTKSDLRLYYMTRNSYVIKKRYMTKLSFFFSLPKFYLKILITSFFYKKKIHYFKVVHEALEDAKNGRMGRRS